jgi:hypothetical protein
MESLPYSVKQIAAAPGEATGSRVNPWQESPGGFEGKLIKASLQDGLHSAIGRVVKQYGPSACGLQPRGAILFGLGDDPLGGFQVVEHSVCKEGFDEL